MSNFLEIFKVITSLLGVLSFSWILYKELKSYLKIEMDVSKEKIKMRIVNSSLKSKKIKVAFLLISKYDDNFGVKFDELTQGRSFCTNSFGDIAFEKFENSNIYEKTDSALINITYFTKENIRVGDETLQAEFPISKLSLKSGIYSVRFFIFPDDKTKQYHRCIHAIFEIKGN